MVLSEVASSLHAQSVKHNFKMFTGAVMYTSGLCHQVPSYSIRFTGAEISTSLIII
jgi:hypothetical protein